MAAQGCESILAAAVEGPDESVLDHVHGAGAILREEVGVAAECRHALAHEPGEGARPGRCGGTLPCESVDAPVMVGGVQRGGFGLGLGTRVRPGNDGDIVARSVSSTRSLAW